MTSYQIPSFSTHPTEFQNSLVYANSLPLPTGVKFDQATRTYDWSGVQSPISFSVVMVGLVSGFAMTD